MTLFQTKIDSKVFDILASSSQNYILMGNLTTNEYKFSDNMLSYLNVDTQNIWENLLHPEDFITFSKILDKLTKQEITQFNDDYRFKTRYQEYSLMNISGVSSIANNGDIIYSAVISETTITHPLDPLTGLKGNFDFRSKLKEITKEETSLGILIIGIDDFKRINDLYTYSLGDKILQKFASKIQSTLPSLATAYRLDGDGFGIVYPKASEYVLKNYFQALQNIAEDSIECENNIISFSISGGICFYPKDGTNDESLYRNARVTLSEAKRKGRKNLFVYNDDIFKIAQLKMRVLENIQYSIKNNFEDFALRYQPLISVVDDKLYGCEVLLRWHHPSFEHEISPSVFIPILEESGLILEVGEWVFTKAIEQYVSWSKMMPTFQMNINISSLQFELPSFKFKVMDEIAKYGINPTFITLELTESGKIKKPDEVRLSFDFLRNQGVKIAFDDFGTGYASLEIFRLLSADELKIDRSFLERISYDVTDQKIISQIIHLCHSMNMRVCVEGIETQEMADLIKQLGPELVQGYFYNQPLSAQSFEQYYFKDNAGQFIPVNPEYHHSVNDYKNSLVYSAFKPAQSLSMDELVNKIYAGIFQVGLDEKFTFLSCNEGYRRMLGYTSIEIEEKFKNHALGFVHPDDVEFVEQEIRRQLGLKDVISAEFRIIRADGSTLWVVGTGNIVRDISGANSLVVIIVDNDSIKRENIMFKNEHDQYKEILENISVGTKLMRYDEDLTLEYISNSYLSLIDFTRDEIKERFDNKYVNMILEEDREEVKDSINKQLENGNIVTLRYRQLTKSGTPIWLETLTKVSEEDKKGIRRAYSSVINISNQSAFSAIDAANDMAQRYQSAAKKWGDVLFDYNFYDSTITFSDNYSTMFNREPKLLVEEEILTIEPSDRVRLRDILNQVQLGIQPEPIELRIKKNDGYIWCNLTFNQADSLGNTPISSLGKICNIDQEYRNRIKLIKQSQQDQMTGLLNKSTIENSIRDIIKNNHSCTKYAFFMIDVDNFKWVNDTLGHIYGDELLCAIADCLKKQFREVDIVGRAGGDEFIVFAKFDGNRDTLMDRGNNLLKALSVHIDKQNQDRIVNVSIGISCYPDDGKKFMDLYRNADSALYKAKEHGRNRCILFK